MRWARFLSNYGMLAVLLLLAGFFSVVTLRDQHPSGAAAARGLLAGPAGARLQSAQGTILIAVRGASHADQAFAGELHDRLGAQGVRVRSARGDPRSVRAALEELADDGTGPPAAIAAAHAYAPLVRSVLAEEEAWRHVPVLTPPAYRWPTFLLPENLFNVANQIAVIAILAIGMTMVIITGGIDLSVGSLIALSAVLVAGLVGHWGGAAAGTGAMLAAGAGAVLLCGIVGLFSGAMITGFRVPPFIATLGMMQVASGLAYILSQGKPIYRLPESFVTLGRGADPLVGIPYAVLLMLALYALAHLVMSRTPLGRYVYAVGGNPEAARLAGVRVKGVLLLVYALNSMLAGLGGVVMASQLKSGAPTYGLMYELYVIAAVVVGGTSLSGGEGRIFGTLIGAFIIAVIQNGMNLTNVESYTQKVVLGFVILGAVLLDRLRHGAWFWRRRPRRRPPEPRGSDVIR